MDKPETMSPQEIDDLRKSLTDLGMEAAEVDEYISKAIKEKEEGAAKEKEEGGEKEEGTESTIAEKAAGDKEEGGKEKEEGSEKEGKPIEKAVVEEEDIVKHAKLTAQKADIEKAIGELEEKMGKKKEEPIEKSIETDIEKSIGARFDDIQKSITDRMADIEKSISEKFSESIESMRSTIEGVQAEVKKIGDTPLGMKSTFTRANFFEKGMSGGESEGAEEKVLSISNDRDDILKGMQDMFEHETDPVARQILSDGISDYTVNARPTDHGVRALALYSRRRNITLEQ